MYHSNLMSVFLKALYKFKKEEEKCQMKVQIMMALMK